MKINKIDHIGINVNDMAAAKAFFLDFGFELMFEWDSEGEWLDEIVGLEGVKTSAIMMRTPDGQTNLELVQYHTPKNNDAVQPPPPNVHGISHIAFNIQGLDALIAKMKDKGLVPFSDVKAAGGYRMCYARGPEGIILELAEQVEQ